MGISQCGRGLLQPPWANKGQARLYPWASFPWWHCCRTVPHECGCSSEGPMQRCRRAASQGPCGTRVWTQANVVGTCVLSGR